MPRQTLLLGALGFGGAVALVRAAERKSLRQRPGSLAAAA